MMVWWFVAKLASLLALAPLPMHPERIAEYENACGPISAFVALQTLGVDVRLADVATDCRWTKGEYIETRNIVGALRKHPQLSVQLKRISQASLKRHLQGGGVAIVLVQRRSTTPDHAVCLIGLGPNGAYQSIEMPQGAGVVDEATLSKVWDGGAILVSPSLATKFSESWHLLVFPFLAVIGFLYLTVPKYFNRRPAAETTLP